jgi:cytochrome c oxidase cbb3-type subunit 3
MSTSIRCRCFGTPVMIVVLAGFTLFGSSCKREQRSFTVSNEEAQASSAVATTDLHAGGTTQPVSLSIKPDRSDYQENAYAISQGQQLYARFNCVGCHANGGGDKGPALMDDKWLYGSDPEQIFATVIQGRPKGMPSFRGKLQNYQVWQIVAYVRSLSGLASKSAAPGRDDHMKKGTPPNSTDPQRPATAPSSPNAGESPT